MMRHTTLAALQKRCHPVGIFLNQLTLEVLRIGFGVVLAGVHRHHNASGIQLFLLHFFVPALGGYPHQHIVQHTTDPAFEKQFDKPFK